MKIYRLLKQPERWIKNSMARAADGNRVLATDPQAVCWCLDGALLRCYPDPKDQERVRAILLRAISIREARVRPAFKSRTLAVWNDRRDRTHSDVLAICRSANV